MGLTSVSVAGCKVLVPSHSPVALVLKLVQARLVSGQLDQALREIDRAWRSKAAFRPVLAHVYARLLMRQGRDWPAAISLLSYGLSDCPTPELEADFADVLQRSGQAQAAAQRLDAALTRFAVSPRGRLARQARIALAGADGRYAGWAAITPAMSLRAEATGESGRVRFELRSESGAILAEKSSGSSGGPPASVEFALNTPGLVGGLHLTADGRPLLGGEQRLPVVFGVDGRAADRSGVIRGWARIGWSPGTRPRIVVRDESGHAKRVSAMRLLPSARWEFEFDTGKSGLRGGQFDVAVVLPDGSSQPLPDSPVITRKAAISHLHAISPAGRPRPSRPRNRPARKIRPVDVIIPAYRDRERTLASIEAVCRTSPQAAAIIVVDDACPDAALSSDLDALAAAGSITLLRNERNLGFAASVNRAMQSHPDHDAVLVNSDVVVFEGWLARLAAPANRDRDIGTVTPMADDDSFVGYGHGPTGLDEVSAAQSLDRVLAASQRGRIIELPVGVGFCLYVRRDCWDQTGPFDEQVFGQGYGEEADFCMRARRLGWRHVLAADVFVHHAGSKSFGSRRPALLERSGRLLNQRHPGYDAFVAEFSRKDAMRPVRRALDTSRLRSMSASVDLVVTLALPGGVGRFVDERCRQIRAEGRTPLILQPANVADMGECILRCEEPRVSNLRFKVPGELALLHELLGSLRIHTVELHHTLGLDPRVIEMVRGFGQPMDVYIHDYSWVCPRITLIDGSGSYCGEPAVSVCEQCIRRNGSNTPEEISVRALRRRSTQWLSSARRVIAPSQDTARRLGRYVPQRNIDVVPHEVFMVDARPPPMKPTALVRIAILGAIGHHKGYKVLLECARDAAKRQLPIEFVVIGYTEDDARLMRTKRVFVTGHYRDSEVGYLLSREAPHAVFLPSVWPETWCYTLSHAIASGLPVAAFDIGAIAERLRAGQGGTLFRLGLSPREINDRLISLGREAMRPEGSAGKRSSSTKHAAVEAGSPAKNMWNFR